MSRGGLVFRLFFNVIQSVLGERLAGVAGLLHSAAVLLLAGVWLLPPVMWGFRRWRSAYGVREGIVVQCWNCGYAGLPHGLVCRHCGRELELPGLLRFSLGLRAWRIGRLASWVGALYHGLGLVCLYLFTAFFAYELDLFRPGPDLRRLFIAIGTIALVGSCVLFRRALSLHSAGPVARLSNLFFGLSALGFVLLFVFIASATAPVEGRYLGTLQNHGSEVTFNNLRVPVTDKGAGIEYLQIEQAGLGYHRLFLLALEGTQRVEVPRDPIARVLLAHLGGAADRYERLGFAVRTRVERREFTTGVAYGVYSSGREIYFQRLQ
ncbi:MAG: hypothetical protein XU15_C0021G0025 [candidate division NC10 bacterium CSP1-5]|nr:MAG: hypothetical protein XU15_C0021G0025 [candidate division NC10 bacterium CSP1-5]